MYSPKVISHNIQQYEQSAKHPLARLDPSKCAGWVDHLAKRWDEENEKWLTPLTKEEYYFIRNERVMSALDYEYWAQRYCTIQADGGGITKHDHPWESQLLLRKLLSRLEEDMFDKSQRGELAEGLKVSWHKARQLGACLGKGTRILTADLRWVPIETIKVGDKLVSVDEDMPRSRGVARKMRISTVLNTVSMEAPTWTLKLSDGTRFTATPHHRFLAKSANGNRYQWTEVQNMKPGYSVRKMVPPWVNEKTYEDGWFAGFLDGEGSVRYKRSGGCELCGAQVAGPVLERAVRYLQENGYKFRFDTDRRKGGESSKFGDQVVYKVVVSRMHDIFRLVGTTRPARFIDKEWWPGKELPNNGGESFVTVVSAEPSIILPVFDMTTTTGTYIAEGVVSHNTAEGRSLMVHRMTTQKNRRCMSASVDDDKIMEMYDRDKLIYDNLPHWLKPSLKYDTKGESITFDGLNSRVLYQIGTQKSGMAVGRQFELGHLTECSSWLNPRFDIEMSFFPTIPQSRQVMVILESTALQIGDWWNQFTEDVRKGHYRGWTYFFIPYYVEQRKYRATPPDNWTPNEVSLRHAQKVFDTSAEFVGKPVMLSREKLYWWETTRSQYQKASSLNLFLSQFCATPEESFQHTTRAVFEAEFIQKLRDTTKAGLAFEVQQL